jgi:hypothetical protein
MRNCEKHEKQNLLLMLYFILILEKVHKDAWKHEK